MAGFTEFRRDGHVHMLFVHPDFQGRGLARDLLDEGHRVLASRGVSRRDAWASLASAPVFRRDGFRVVGTRMAPAGPKYLMNFRVVRPMR